VVVLLALSVFVNYIDRANLAIAAPLIQAELGLRASELGVLLSAFFWTYALCQLATGWLVDRYPAGLVLAAGFALWSAATAATGLVGAFGALLGVRLILGMGESVAYPSYSKIFAQHVPEHRRGFANAAISAGLAAGPAVGMFAGGLLVARLGWRSFFVGLGIGSLAWLIPWLAWMPRGDAQAGDRGRPSVATRAIVQQRAFWGTASGLFASNYLNYFMLTWLPLYVVRELHLSLDRMAVISGTYFGLAALAALGCGWLSDRAIARGRQPERLRVRLAAVGLAGVALALVIVAFVSPALSLAFLFIAAISNGVTGASLWAVTQTLAGATAAGRWTGAQNFLGNLAGIAAPALTGVIVDRTGHFAGAFAVTALVATLGAAAWSGLVGDGRAVAWGPVGASLDGRESAGASVVP